MSFEQEPGAEAVVLRASGPPERGVAAAPPQASSGQSSAAASVPPVRFGDVSLHEIVRRALQNNGRVEWELHDEEFWCRVEPAEHERRVQGWKLHVSATPLSAPHVLHRASAVLSAGDCAFKFARSLGRVGELTSARCSRAQAGKFITAYPRDDDHFRALAAELDAATAGMPGPQILSDRPYRKGSLVHYRYGAFHGVPTLTNDGSFEARIEQPDGTPVEDVRQPWFAPPSWANLPIDDPEARPWPAKPKDPKPVLLDDRFVVREAIVHSARGGVYRATDQHTGRDVVIKQARPHIGAQLTGTDGRDVLRAEGGMLAELAGLAPDLVSLFERDGHVFLAEEAIAGVVLSEWVTRHWTEADTGEGIPVHIALAMARRLTDLLDEVHRRGFVFRDFTPNNIMVIDGDDLRLVDPELAMRPGQWTHRAYTPGFAAPEALAAPTYGPALDGTADLYSLGAVLFYLVTGTGPAFAEDTEPGEETGAAGGPARTHRDRLAQMMSLAGVRDQAVRRVAPAVLGLTASDPARRWTLDDVRSFLDDESPDIPSGLAREPLVVAGTDRIDDATCDRLIDDGLAHILATMDTSGPRLWTTGEFGNNTDPCAVQYGAAGVLAVLTSASETLGRPELRDAVATVARWIDARRHAIPRLLPGLYFGRSGTVWALYDAARHLGDDVLADHAVDLALRLPVRWPNPDICHGASGAGLGQLHLWQATGRAEFSDRVSEAADGVLAAAEHTDDGVFWPVPTDFDSQLAGIWHYGFAHGVAGVGAFLLAAGEALDRPDLLEAARQAGDTLLAAADVHEGDGGAVWRSDHKAPEKEGMSFHWCSGSSGIGTFLVRLARHVSAEGAGEPYLEMARRAAVAVRRSRWFASPVACHGLAGNGDFLLDLAQAGEREYHGWAGELAACMHARNVIRDGRLLLPDETRFAVTADYNTGLAGSLGFLMRLRHGGPRFWMVDGARR